MQQIKQLLDYIWIHIIEPLLIVVAILSPFIAGLLIQHLWE